MRTDEASVAQASPAFSTHQYVENSSNFEQSLDVYLPTTTSAGAAQSPPLVVLVVGSGWLGHREFLYSTFNKENAAGPRNLAAIGCVCVAVRHRGAFVQPPNFTLSALVVVSVLALKGLLWLVAAALLWLGWWLTARGAATHDEMMDDVAQALAWVRRHRAELMPGGDGAQSTPACTLVGGYSSGGHVLVSLLSRPDKLKQWRLPPAAAGFDGVLLISGVLASHSAPPLPPPSLATWLVTWLVPTGPFGLFADQLAGVPRRTLPSPLHSIDACCAVPHLLVHCVHEAFALPIVEPALSHLLCTTPFANALRARGDVPVRVEAIESNHWKILGSATLADALTRALFDESWPASAKKRAAAMGAGAVGGRAGRKSGQSGPAARSRVSPVRRRAQR